MSKGPKGVLEPFFRVTKNCNFATKTAPIALKKRLLLVLNTTDRQAISANLQKTGAFSGDSQDILSLVRLPR